MAAVAVDALAARVVAAVGETRSTWTVWNLHAEAERLLRADPVPGGPTTHHAAVEAVVRQAVSPGYSISVEAPTMLGSTHGVPADLRRADGESVFVEHAAARYTSTAVLDAEARLLDAATSSTQRARPGAAGMSSAESVAVALDAFETATGSPLDAGQRHLVTVFATDPRALVVGIGAAGTGKTTAMRAYLHVLEAAGTGETPGDTTGEIRGAVDSGLAGRGSRSGARQAGRLVPLATSAASAAVLAAELGVPAENLHKFLHEHRHGPHADDLTAGRPVPTTHAQFALRPGDTVLVDEAGMAGTFNLDRLQQIATQHGARVRWLGDYRQLAPWSPAARCAWSPRRPALRSCPRFTGSVTRPKPQPPSSYASATAKVWTITRRAGGSLAGRGRRCWKPPYTGWLTDVRAGKSSFMPAATNTDVVNLSARARIDRVTAGDVEPGGVLLHDGNTAGVGEWIVTRSNQRRMSMNGGRDFVRNGDPWRVTARTPEGALHVRHLGHGGCTILPAGYVGESVELLYATTAHRVQGGTVDTAHPLVTDAMTREAFYVTATRAREATTFYVTTHDLLPLDDDDRLDASGYDPDARAAREVLTGILARTGAEPSATQAIRDNQNTAESLVTLIPRYQHALHQHLQQVGREQQLAGEPDCDVHYVDARPGRAMGRFEYAVPIGQILGSRLATRVVTEPGWPAVQVALRRAETCGHEPFDVLRQVVNRRQLHQAVNASQELARRIGQHLTPVEHEPAGTRSVLPWVEAPPAGAPAYLRESAQQIRTRVAHLAEHAVREQPRWMMAFPPAPDQTEDPQQYREWWQQVAVVATYREHHAADQIVTPTPGAADDEAVYPLGPYIEPDQAGHRAYWHAAAAIVTAHTQAETPDVRDVEGRDRTHLADTTGWPDRYNPAGHQVAVDIYRGLDVDQRRAVLTSMVVTAGNLWFGHPDDPDTAIVQVAHHRHLTDALTRAGHLTAEPAIEPSLEAEQLRTGRSPRPRASRPTGRPAAPGNRRPNQQQDQPEMPDPARSIPADPEPSRPAPRYQPAPLPMRPPAPTGPRPDHGPRIGL